MGVEDLECTPPAPGPWMQGRAHLSVAVTPSVQFACAPGMIRGLAEMIGPWGALLDGMNIHEVNGLLVHAARPVRRTWPRR